MGTETEYAINVLEAPRNRNNKRFVYDWEFSSKRVEDSMDRMLVNYNVDSIKKTMKMHEDVFKHQVRELHRLYSVQKTLMDDLTKERKRRNIWDPTNNIAINSNSSNRSDIHNSQLINWHNQPATNTYAECSASSMGFDLESPAKELISKGVGKISNYQRNQSNNNKTMKLIVPEDDSDVELRLSIGNSSTSLKSNCVHVEEPDSSANSLKSDPTTPMSSSSATVDQERKQPHWLFHGLKLK